MPALLFHVHGCLLRLRNNCPVRKREKGREIERKRDKGGRERGRERRGENKRGRERERERGNADKLKSAKKAA